MKKMTEKTMRKADGGYFHRGVKIYNNGRWEVVYEEATGWGYYSGAANNIRKEANAMYAMYSSWGYRCRFF